MNRDCHPEEARPRRRRRSATNLKPLVGVSDPEPCEGSGSLLPKSRAKRGSSAECKGTTRNLLFALAICVLLIPAHAQQAPPADPELQKIKTPPLPEFHPQLPKRVVLPNGMVLLLQEAHELPLIEGTMRIRGGSRLEPSAKVGLVDIYGYV